MNPTYGLEYALFFGVPNNKLELIHGASRWAFPFLSRAEAEMHFEQWLETCRRWKQVDRTTPIRKSEGTWLAEVGGIRMELFPRPIELRIPISVQAFDVFYDTFNRREFWPNQPAGHETGWDSPFHDNDVRSNLWSLLEGLSHRHGGIHSGRVDIALAPWASVAPDACYYKDGREKIMIGHDYFCAAPDLVVEVLTAPSRWLDRGPRMEIYRRAGVPHLWLIEPAQETVEVYELHSQFELVARHRIGNRFASRLFPDEHITVDSLFATQSKRWNDRGYNDEEPEPIPEWIFPAAVAIGLEHFFLLGHPERRWEFWDNKARSVLAFGSSAEASVRLGHFVTEACRWESLPPPKISKMAEDVELTEAGRFQLTRQGRLVFLDVAIDGRRHHELLNRWANRDSWDWGAD